MRGVHIKPTFPLKMFDKWYQRICKQSNTLLHDILIGNFFNQILSIEIFFRPRDLFRKQAWKWNESSLITG